MPEIVFALIFVIAFGLGPMVGVLAIAIHTAGALGKLFAEVVENIDMKPVESLTASGATPIEAIRFAVLPQVLSNFASYGLLRFEINVRGAGVMGFVEAGGIGQEFLVAIRNFYYTDVSAILLLVILTVMAIDLTTERLRHRLLGLNSSKASTVHTGLWDGRGIGDPPLNVDGKRQKSQVTTSRWPRDFHDNEGSWRYVEAVYPRHL